MRRCRRCFPDISREERAKHLVKDHGEVNKEASKDSIHRISSRLGGLYTRHALQHLEKGGMYDVAKMMLAYYDKYYSKGVAKRDPKMVTSTRLKTTNPIQNSIEISKRLNGL